MKINKLNVLLFIAVLFFSCKDLIGQVQCGVERWGVKTLSDPDTSNIDFSNEVTSTVHEQVVLTAPKNFPKDLPRQKSEETVYRIKCLILGFKKEDDKDIHIVIQDPSTQDKMIAELPSAECPEVLKTSRYEQFKELNEWFVNNIGSPIKGMTWLQSPKEVELSGVGFFDFPHGQTGRAPNGREIHPVLSMDLIENIPSIAANEVASNNTTTQPSVKTPNTEIPFLTSAQTKVQIQMSNSIGDTLSLILVGAILGIVGQLIRILVGIKKSNDKKEEGETLKDIIVTKQLLFSLLISLLVGCVAGALAAFNIIGSQIDKTTLLAFIGAGYAGTDFIEGFIIKK